MHLLIAIARRCANTLPKLVVRPIEQLQHHWWSMPPFQQQKIVVPIFQAKGGQYSNNNLVLDSKIFNVPIRKDLIYRLMHWARNRDKISTKRTLTKSTVSGSGKKPRPQKKTGLPRIGNKRASGRWKGGKAHGPKPTIYTFHLNNKIKLKGIKSLLTSKLAEGRIRIIADFQLETYKTKNIREFSFIRDCESGINVLFLTDQIQENLARATSNILHITIQTIYQLDIHALLKTDRIYFTESGIKTLQQSLNKTQTQLYLQRHQKTATPKSRVNPFTEHQFKELPFFQQYKELLEQAKVSNKERLQRQIKKTVRRPVC